MDFFVVGAQKSGTTSLFEYLRRHPNIYIPDNKELEFFSSDALYSKGSESYDVKFNQASECQLRGDISPQYMYEPKAARRISEYNGDAKIICILRDPVERALSHFMMNKRRGHELRTLPELVEDYRSAETYDEYIANSMYGAQLEPYFQFFKHSNILVLWSSDLKTEPLATITSIERFLGIPEKLTQFDVSQNFHVGGTSRFPLIYRFYKGLRALPKWPKELIKAVFGAKRIAKIAYLWETRYSISRVDSVLLSDEDRQVLLRLFEKDIEQLECLVGEVPWAN
ncbi:MAG: sulfotransferase domain-containing protein [Pseudomonadales bacterium]|jgi:hypothetical protein